MTIDQHPADGRERVPMRREVGPRQRLRREPLRSIQFVVQRVARCGPVRSDPRIESVWSARKRAISDPHLF